MIAFISRMIKRLRSYTAYSEDNGDLVPSMEPFEYTDIDGKTQLGDNRQKKLNFIASSNMGCGKQNDMDCDTPYKKMDNSTYDFSKMMRLTKSLQTVFNCTNCKQAYDKKWCKEDICFFCTNYLPMRDTYSSILRDLDWQFLRSGESSRPEFYKAFLDNLEKWSQRFHILPTKQDLKDVEEMRNIKDWTRQYWH